MPFVKMDVQQEILKRKKENTVFAEKWDDSRMEYKLLGEMVRLRKEKGLSQAELAGLTGNKQQVISRIEKKENSPTLRTFCNIINALGYDMQIVKR